MNNQFFRYTCEFSDKVNSLEWNDLSELLVQVLPYKWAKDWRVIDNRTGEILIDSGGYVLDWVKDLCTIPAPVISDNLLINEDVLVRGGGEIYSDDCALCAYFPDD